MLKRQLEVSKPSPAELDVCNFQSRIRLGNGRTLLRFDWCLWKAYR